MLYSMVSPKAADVKSSNETQHEYQSDGAAGGSTILAQTEIQCVSHRCIDSHDSTVNQNQPTSL